MGKTSPESEVEFLRRDLDVALRWLRHGGDYYRDRVADDIEARVKARAASSNDSQSRPPTTPPRAKKRAARRRAPR